MRSLALALVLGACGSPSSLDLDAADVPDAPSSSYTSDSDQPDCPPRFVHDAASKLCLPSLDRLTLSGEEVDLPSPTETTSSPRYGLLVVSLAVVADDVTEVVPTASTFWSAA